MKYLRAGSLLLLVALAALFGIVGSSVWMVERTDDYLSSVVEARAVQSAAVDLRNLLQDMEAGQRGFLLTHDALYLEPYRQSQGLVDAALNRVEARLGDYGLDEAQTRELRANVENKIAELARTIELEQGGRSEEALALVNSDAGKRYMDAAQDLLDRIVANTDTLIGVAIDRERQSVVALRWISFGGAALIILTVGVAAFLTSNYTRALMTVRRQLETANTRLEDRVTARTSQLAEANEEIQRFAYIVTHDLRAPLVNIMGFTSELEAAIEPIRRSLGDGGGDEQSRRDAQLAVEEDMPEAIAFIRSSTGRMDYLINAILRISRDGRRPLKPDALDLSAILATAVEAIQHQISELDGSVDLQPDFPSIVSDRLAVEQIVGNLLDNAVKYHLPSRPLRIRISGHRLSGGRYAIDVEDNGRGIAEADLGRVFELFRRSGEQAEASEGIGLTHVRMLVRNLGGDITLSSQLGEGSTFRVILPLDSRTALGSADA